MGRRTHLKSPFRSTIGLLRSVVFSVTALAYVPQIAYAQNLQNFRPSPGTNGVLIHPGALTTQQNYVSSRLIMSAAKSPLVRRNTDGSETAVIEQQLGFDATLAWGSMEMLEVGLVIPFGHLRGEALRELRDDGFALGDIRFSTKVHLSGSVDERYALGADLTISAPTGRTRTFYGASDFTFHPRFLVDTYVDEARFHVSAGFMLRPQTEVFENIELGHEMTYGAGFSIQLDWFAFELLGEIYGAMPLTHVLDDTVAYPIEGLLGVQYVNKQGVYAMAGSGFGLHDGRGVPSRRLLFSIGYRTDLPQATPPAPQPVTRHNRRDDIVVSRDLGAPVQPSTAAHATLDKAPVTPNTSQRDVASNSTNKVVERTSTNTPVPPAQSHTEHADRATTEDITQGDTPSSEPPGGRNSTIASETKSTTVKSGLPETQTASVLETDAPSGTEVETSETPVPGTSGTLAPDTTGMPQPEASDAAESETALTVESETSDTSETNTPGALESETTATSESEMSDSPEPETPDAPEAQTPAAVEADTVGAETQKEPRDEEPETPDAPEAETPAAVEADTVGAEAQKEPRNVESETPTAPKSEPSSGTVAETEVAPPGASSSSIGGAETPTEPVADDTSDRVSNEPRLASPVNDAAESDTSTPTVARDSKRQTNTAVSERRESIIAQRQPITFNTGQMAVGPQFDSELRRIARLINSDETPRMILVEGHSSPQGKPKTNVLLSSRRAQEVRNRLIQFGVPRTRMTYAGYGASQPPKEGEYPGIRGRRVVIRWITADQAPYRIQKVSKQSSTDALVITVKTSRPIDQEQIEFSRDEPTVLMIRLRGAQIYRTWLTLDDPLINKALLHPSTAVPPSAIIRIRMTKPISESQLAEMTGTSKGRTVEIRMPRQ